MQPNQTQSLFANWKLLRSVASRPVCSRASWTKCWMPMRSLQRVCVYSRKKKILL